MKIINNKFQKITVAIIFSWLIFFVLIPNLLVLTVSFLTRDGSDFYALPFTLDNYANLFNPLYAQVVWNSLYMSGIATIICLLIGYPFAFMVSKINPEISSIFVIPRGIAILDKLTYSYLWDESLPWCERCVKYHVNGYGHFE